MKKTARATVEKVQHQYRERTIDTCRDLKLLGYQIYCLEITDDSVPLDSVSFSDVSKLALVVGNENLGIQEEVLKMADHRLHIRMFGENSSMNVAQSAAIALYEITKSLPAFPMK